MIAKFVEDLVHLERGQDRLDEHRGADAPVRNAEDLLRVDKDVVPEPRFQMRLHLRQVKIRPAAARDRFLRVVKKVQAEIEEACRYRLAIDDQMLLQQMPPARPDNERRGLLVQGV